MKFATLILSAMLIQGCQTQPMSPQEAAAYQQIGDAFTDGAQAIRPQKKSQECQVTNWGGGNYTTDCSN